MTKGKNMGISMSMSIRGHSMVAIINKGVGMSNGKGMGIGIMGIAGNGISYH